jgi:prephenate dehydrogenase
MTIQITIIGLGQIGASIGLALAKHTEEIKRVGNDREPTIQNRAKSLGACDTVQFNLPAAVKGADVVILAIPLDQVEETLKYIAEDLREDAVVMDFSPQTAVTQKWFAAEMPAGRHYVSLVPAINPVYLDQPGLGIEAARVDLFEKATIGITAPPGTPGEALKLAGNLIERLNAKPIFLDMLEADGMMMTVHLLPQVLAAALFNATAGQPGWTDARRFAGRPFAQATAPLEGTNPKALEEALLANPEGAAHALEMAIGALTHLREAVRTGDREDLEKRLRLAAEDRETWLQERRRAEWDVQANQNKMPSVGDTFKRILIGERPKK